MMNHKMLLEIYRAMRDVQHPEQADPRTKLEWLRSGKLRVSNGKMVLNHEALIGDLMEREAQPIAPAVPTSKPEPSPPSALRRWADVLGLPKRFNDSPIAQVVDMKDRWEKLREFIPGGFPFAGFSIAALASNQWHLFWIGVITGAALTATIPRWRRKRTEHLSDHRLLGRWR